MQRMLDGYGYDMTGIDVIDAYGHFLKSAEKLAVVLAARDDAFSMATIAERKGSPFAGILLRRCSPESLL